MSGPQVLISNIQRYCVHDGPGIRTLIFMKGCPLRCLWCCNPETQTFRLELLFLEHKCILCRRCIYSCKVGAISFDGNRLMTNRKVCVGCGECTKVCYPEARTFGRSRWIGVDELVREVMADLRFYLRSGGGVTLSGGEPLMQPESAEIIAEKCKRYGISIAIETSGYARWENFRRVVQHCDVIFCDIKHMDPVVHRELTGVSNEPILENIRRCNREFGTDKVFIIRIPIVPGYTDSKDNLEQAAEFISNLEHVTRVELLKYHRLGMAKYGYLGKEYQLASVLEPSDSHMAKAREIVQSYGLKVQVAGQQ